ncbi:hypothetical protein ADIAL_1798 [Alkalibacterium sp. AK22]|uniref:competence type IV pilus minor pilin ComGD n=1 Tax=Alkalibacterium sp. AK22 TaxID=1229520 RepID=UPI00044A4381|nr:competence type IV pilus minor pilin ComGD [Alkalibacterium sp. AK22]EXJ22776.1 hypothetical protein ADIAL_1798 [Alkalibacterium sp. AK22]
MLKQEDGMTMIESLLVLSLVSVIISMPVAHFKRLSKRTETELFIEAMSASLTLVQNYAVLNDEWTVVEFKPSHKEVSFRVVGRRGHPIEHTLVLPDHLQMLNNGMEFRFSRKSGNIGTYGPVRFRTPEGMIEFAFQMGSGRFEIRKPE